MDLYPILKLAHILCVLCLTAGMLGRGLVRAHIRQLSDIQSLHAFVQLEGQFDWYLVIYGSQLTVLTGILLAVVGGWPFIAGGHPTWVSISIVLFLSTLVPVVWVFTPRGRRFGQALQDALAQKQITAELRAAHSDSAVKAAYVYEFVVISLLLILMVTKPF